MYSIVTIANNGGLQIQKSLKEYILKVLMTRKTNFVTVW